MRGVSRRCPRPPFPNGCAGSRSWRPRRRTSWTSPARSRARSRRSPDPRSWRGRRACGTASRATPATSRRPCFSRVWTRPRRRRPALGIGSRPSHCAPKRMVQAMDFRFLFDSSRKLFSIGYRVADGTLDPSCYDLLASEARLGSFVAIAKGDVSPRHWFLLGRALTPVGRGAALVSWSGSMFEYLMPLLVMRQPARSLLDLTCRLVVARQIQYGAERAVPWGVSESAHNLRDVELTYQYSDFGVPGLGLKRGLFEDVVVAPYATALAAMLEPESRARQLRAPRGGRSARRLRVLRSPRLHTVESSGERPGGRGPELHGPSPGNDPRLAGQRGSRRPDPEALSRPSDGPGGGAAAAGTDAAFGGRDPAPGRGGAGGAARPRPRSPHAAAVRIAARHHAAHPSPFQRPLHGHDHGGGLRLQPMARPRRHPLAGGHDA